jgi:hypothetical protein
MKWIWIGLGLLFSGGVFSVERMHQQLHAWYTSVDACFLCEKAGHPLGAHSKPTGGSCEMKGVADQPG